ncbi:MAG: response regulator [Proteobacteria bacterium]|nr:MAG: response regulator [Pseudomonadota bacterium]
MDSVSPRKMQDSVPVNESVSGESLLVSEFWNLPLERFSQATGMTVSLYDDQGERRAGPFGSGPIFDCLLKAGFFAADGVGHEFENRTAVEAKAFKEVNTVSFHGTLGLCTVPILVAEKLIGTLVVGWVPNNFADAVSSYRVAHAIGIHEMDMWAAIRSQQPMTLEKMTINVEMLHNFVEAILLQLKIKEEDQNKARILEVLNRSAVSLSKAENIEEILASVSETAEKLVPGTSAKLIIIGDEKGVHSSQHSLISNPIHNEVLSLYTTRIPIVSSNRIMLGYLDIGSQRLGRDLLLDSELNSLAAQAAVAIQKTRLIQTLHEERQVADKTNSELRALHRMKDEFLATISHELRTPLNSILGWSQIINEELLPPEELAEATAAIERNALVQAKLIEDLLDVSRIISGKMNLERNLIDLRDVLMRSIETVKPISEAKSQVIELELPEGIFPVRGDPTRLQQVFWNILSNSVKFTPDSGTLRVSLKKTGGYAKIMISDNGKGIPTEFLPHLFDRFSQADGSNTRTFGGLGLGLAIVRHVVELHGGSIHAQSDGEGLGSTFYITLPVNMSEHELDTARLTLREMDHAEEGGRSLLKGMKILAVDDEEDSLRMISFLLEKAGSVVKAVTGAREALIELKEWRPDLIVSDISMPETDGYELLRQIRSLSLADGGSTPAIALTAFAGDKNKQDALDAGFQKHFPKPLDPKKLLASIRDFANYH